MKRLLKYMTILVLFIVCLTILGCQREEKADYRIIQVVEKKGIVKVERETTGTLDAYENMNLENKDKVIVDKESYVRLLLDKDKYVYIEPNSVVSLEASGNDKDSKTKIRIEKGAMITEIQNSLSDDSEYKVITPNSSMSVRGTVYRVEVKEDNNKQPMTYLSVFEGIVDSRLLEGNKESEKAIDVKAGKGVIVHVEQEENEYLLFDNEKPFKDVKLKDFQLETLEILKEISLTQKDIIFSSEEIQKQIDSLTQEEPTYKKPNNSSQESKPKTPIHTIDKVKYRLRFFDQSFPLKSYEYYENDSIVSPQMTKQGYDFEGWYLKDNKTRFDLKTMPDYSIDVYAKWKPQIKTITFVDKYQDIPLLKAKVNSSITLPTPTQEGYLFKGWYLDETYKQVYTSQMMPTYDIKLYAKYSPREDITYQVEKYVKAKDDSEYRFHSSTSHHDGITDEYYVPEEKMIDHNITYHLVLNESYQIKGNGESVFKIYYVYQKEDRALLTLVDASGYQNVYDYKVGTLIKSDDWNPLSSNDYFLGWNTQADGTGKYLSQKDFVIEESQVYYEICFVDYSIVWKVETLDFNIGGYQNVMKFSMRGINGSTPILKDIIQNHELVRMSDYTIVYPSNSESLEYGKEKTYEISYKYKKQKTSIRYNGSNKEIYERIYPQGSYLLGLESGLVSHEYGRWYADINDLGGLLEYLAHLIFGTSYGGDYSYLPVSIDSLLETEVATRLEVNLEQTQNQKDYQLSKTYRYINKKSDNQGMLIPTPQLFGYKKVTSQESDVGKENIVQLNYDFMQTEVTFDIQNISNSQIISKVLTTKDKLDLLHDVEVKDEQFVGWKVKNSSNQDYITFIEGTMGDMELIADWK